ncbi:hypothetical protein PC118_g9163 [Phytophthora cactorum]|nr:hypothetical protein PC118_g9163 [Phytophthora cactorum]
MDRFLVGGEATASYRRDRWSARPLVEERSVLQALTKYEVAHQNKFSGRPKRVLDEDEIPECNCHRGRDWSVTCGIGCENRSIQVECVRGSCSTGGHCSNQQMQDGSNALLSVKKAPDKGIALLTCQQFLPGAFVCQYTGEIIRRTTNRRREMELKSATNYYSMAVTNNEVIGARAIGGLARFANHSCQPNCVIERWDVNGGKTATKRRKKCLCKEPGCRGLIPMRFKSRSRTLWTSGSDPTQHRRTQVQHQMVKPSQNSRAAKAARRVLAVLGTQRSETPRKKRRTMQLQSSPSKLKTQ